MGALKKIITTLIVLSSFYTCSYGQDKIVFLDLDKVVINTKAGKSIIDKLEKSKKAALQKFEKKERDLKKKEDEIKKQKNIISEEELKKRLVEFRKEVSSFRENRQKLINDFNQKRKAEFDEFFKKITPIIESYVSEKNIDILLDKKNIFVASKKKNITSEIIKIIDSKIK
jgi:outer membrane protein